MSKDYSKKEKRHMKKYIQMSLSRPDGVESVEFLSELRCKDGRGKERRMKLIDLENPAHVYCGEHGEYENWNIDSDVPTVDAVPVRHGKWLYIRTDENENGVYECSECHAGEVHSTIVDVRYCWNCGARMDEE